MLAVRPPRHYHLIIASESRVASRTGGSDGSYIPSSSDDVARRAAPHLAALRTHARTPVHVPHTAHTTPHARAAALRRICTGSPAASAAATSAAAVSASAHYAPAWPALPWLARTAAARPGLARGPGGYPPV